MPTAVVTGSSAGIGAAVCRALRGRAWHVAGLSRRPSPDADEHEACDVSDRQQVEAAAGRLLERHPRLDLLVLNAGIPAGSSFLEIDLDLLELVTRTNYLGAVWCLRAFLPGLERGSHVVNVVSIAGMVADGPYSASKHAQLAFSRSVAIDLGRRGISVHTINPGLVDSEGFRNRGRVPPSLQRIVVDPPYVAERILAAIEHDRREIVVPRWYRPFGWGQALFPATLARARVRSSRG